jgi:hypothetical protein
MIYRDPTRKSKPFTYGQARFSTKENDHVRRIVSRHLAQLFAIRGNIELNPIEGR